VQGATCRGEAAALLTLLTTPEVAPAMAGALLAALRAKGSRRLKYAALRVPCAACAKTGVAEALDASTSSAPARCSGSLNLSTGRRCWRPLAACRGQAWQSLRFQPQRQRGFDRAAWLYDALGREPGGTVFCGHRFHVFVRAVFSPAMKALAPIRAALAFARYSIAGAVDQSAAPRFRLIGAYDAATAELMGHAGGDGHRACLGGHVRRLG